MENFGVLYKPVCLYMCKMTMSTKVINSVSFFCEDGRSLSGKGYIYRNLKKQPELLKKIKAENPPLIALECFIFPVRAYIGEFFLNIIMYLSV